MMNHILDKTLERFVLEGSISRKESDIYRFGLECMFLKIVHYISYFLIAFILHSLGSLLLSACIFAPLRSRIGGYHAKTRWGCYVFSCFMVLFLCILNGYQIPNWFLIFGLLFADIVIYLLAPVTNESNPLELEEEKQFHKQAVGILLVANFFILGMMWKKIIISRYMFHGIIMAAVLLLLGKTKEWMKAEDSL